MIRTKLLAGLTSEDVNADMRTVRYRPEVRIGILVGLQE
ncbi:hypothetical protein SAMN00790413_06493 [Deinococcus hopiensis KR-140]|uniref:Uncharacterized protein n=1 Tax=Deinococcus hopiensis KR-140 TaxID=695939 RepID=A0A1W1UAN4_9DEIO|nr:hypothetical protein SAMN00790413_06493 [Deinococcus hopiensis KR-140]